ncbi:cation diffusion facilitator family transporter [Salibacterium qingdaonense]|uniref:Cobalt-zinc-cadmium efflux system protein n=1 Tax=Salibacterium qingdaonense TaxID=266892 RepID=A0A1I4ILV0_9BACI|nr:cation diffusion facilitator family transporter [Salibacterium qingdaonense]SFL55254.1 cobalt-zinc-cadmium efflux system protein [Salibacterium qingdaonense]
MSHDHGHDHTHGANKKALMIAFIITTVYMIVEAIGGIITNSLALLSDAGHMLSDSISLGVGLAAFIVGEKAVSRSKTFGYKRFEILAALFNGATLIAIALYIMYEAYQRFIDPPDVASVGMLFIGFLGLLVNILVAWMLMSKGDTEDNLNLRAAFLHVIGDLLGSVGAIAAGLLIFFFNWGWADPFASVIVAILITISGIRVVRESIHVLMEGSPKNIDIHQVQQTIETQPEIQSIHDLHVWNITSEQIILSCHAVVSGDYSLREGQQVLGNLEKKLKDVGIQHATIQLETSDHPHDEQLLCSIEIEEEDHGHRGHAH